MNEKKTISVVARNTKKFLEMRSVDDLQQLLKEPITVLYKNAKFPEYHQFEIPKSTSGYRQITAPEKNLKRLQRKINNFIQDVYHFQSPDCSHGFIHAIEGEQKIKTIISNANEHTNRNYVLNIDLKDFFHSISATRIRDQFRSEPFNFDEQLAICLALICTFKKKLPMGAPSSPTLSNMVCLELDSRLKKLAKSNEMAYTRYADDLTFSSDNKFAKGLIQKIEGVVTDEGFEINPKKFRIQSKNSRQTVTGIIVNEKPNVNRRYIRKLRAALYDSATLGIHTAACNYFKINGKVPKYINDRFFRSLKGKIVFVGFVRGRDDRVYQKLRTEFDNIFIR